MKNQKLPRDFRRRIDQFWDQYIAQAKANSEDPPKFYDSLTQTPKTGLQYLGRPEDLPSLESRVQQIFHSVPWDNNHFLLENIQGTKAKPPGRDLFHDLGLIYIQEPAAAMPIASVDLSQANHILDLCAAPGGKTSQIHQSKNPQATLWANDIDVKRARVLQQNMLRIGASNVLVSCSDAANFKETGVSFDFIMLDAPCSGEALLRRKPQTAYQWRTYPPKVMARTQRQILDDIWPCLEPGGRLLYATCTFNTVENEELVAAFVLDQADAKIVPFDQARTEGMRPGLELKHCPDTKLANRVFPHDGWGEGQFAILLEKDHRKAPPTSPSIVESPTRITKIDPKTFAPFGTLDLTEALPDYEFILHEGRLHAIRPQELALVESAPTMDFYKIGIYLGDYSEAHFQPSESWASLQATKTWEFQVDLTDQSQMLADLRSGREQRWPTDLEGLYLLTAYDRGIAWLDIRKGLTGTLTLTQALRSL